MTTSAPPPPPQPQPPKRPPIGQTWPAPKPVTPGLLIAILCFGVWVAATFLARPGLQWTLAALAALMLAVWAARFAPAEARQGSRWRIVFGLLALGLAGTLAVRDSGPMMAVVILAALGVSTFAVVDDPRPRGLVLAPVYAVVAWVRAFAWWPVIPSHRLRGIARHGALLRGIWIAVGLCLIVGGLLASADRAFLGLVSELVPAWSMDILVARLMLAGVVVSIVTALMFGVASPPQLGAGVRSRRGPVDPAHPSTARPGTAEPGAPGGSAEPKPVAGVGSMAEWLVPIAALVLLLGVFFGVQAAVLFDAYPDELVHGGLTPAERARQGFGQLVCVSLIIAGALTWAVTRAERAHRRYMIIAGGLLLLQLELLVGSALRRMYLYENTFGWTVLRVQVAWFEVWLGLITLLLAALWLAGLGRHSVRITVFSAGLGILILALAGPDLIVARASVDRFERTGKIDTYYLDRLGPDAVPALAELPEPQLSCALSGDPGGLTRRRLVDDADPYYAYNVSRARAVRILDGLQLQSDPAVLADCPTPWTTN